MVDFKKLVKKRTDIDVTDYFSIFESLDRKTTHIELRTVQKETLSTFSKRREERDVVLKIGTGAGKTTVALLYLQSYMEEFRKPVVYLCPTKQLVMQVQEEANRLGIKTVIYPGGETYPPNDGRAGNAIIICTYAKLFNAKTTFDRPDVMLKPYAIVLDDAHAGVEEIRDAFTIKISENKIYDEFMEVLNLPCSKYSSSIWSQIINRDPQAFLEVPFWVWEPLLETFQKILSLHGNERELKFVWSYLQDILRWCRCIVSGYGIEIIPDILPIHKCQAFEGSRHRMFMSATLADDSVLVRELGCDLKAAQNPILPKSDRGLGERMVLAPSLVSPNLDREWVMKLCAKISLKRNVNVIVLSPNKYTAQDWESVGAKVVLGDEVSVVLKQLRDNSNSDRLIVFVQRYDGVDLPDNSCRILVIDGLPKGEGIIDRYDSSHTSYFVGGIRNKLVFRIEQGMGRAVRSFADYAVILLVGSDITHFISIREVLDAMNPETRAQLQLADELAKFAMDEEPDTPEKAVVEMIKQCLTRDEGWKQYYAEKIRNTPQKLADDSRLSRILLADAERKAFDRAIANIPHEAASILRDAMNNNIKDDTKITGWYLQRVANYLHNVNPGEALEVQREAYIKNKSMSCPPYTARRPKDTGSFDVQKEIMNWYNQFKNPNGALAKILELKTNLSYNMPPLTVEQAIMELGLLLGAKASNPEKEYGCGPDALWIWPEVALVIEAKNQNESTLHKADAGQLHTSLEWFSENYVMRASPIPVVYARVSKADRNAYFPSNTRVLLPESMEKLLKSIEKFYLRLAEEQLLSTKPGAIKNLQNSLNLSPKQFVQSYTVKIRKISK